MYCFFTPLRNVFLILYFHQDSNSLTLGLRNALIKKWQQPTYFLHNSVLKWDYVLPIEKWSTITTFSMVSVNSECQVLALLDLKTNLSKADVRSIRKSLTENRYSLNAETTTAFFCKVPIKRKFMTVFYQWSVIA